MKKIYCSNCKYCYWSDYSSYGGDYCCKLLLQLDSNFYRIYKVDTRCEDKNKNNDCLDYKRIWYKFWIK
jgi:hypothetical protein